MFQEMENKQQKRASTQALRDDAEPNKRTSRSQDRSDRGPEGIDLLSQIWANREAQKSTDGWVERKVRQH
ncbi:hypothetical protein GX50_06532 [[Emmonsia] crescens]|uniref:Uncharacterized protein n=1 Tax=[Emmonsia] crescens TaxID=73230 RepID=A0A2B7ZBY3_9EURO|nr:hypothetical protein GX50_06532 [Emmonsia crescens]